jgi:hypothetical protein
METNKQRENMELIFHMLTEMKVTKKQREQLSRMLETSFVNGYHSALAEHTEASEVDRSGFVIESETVQHIAFLARESGK